MRARDWDLIKVDVEKMFRDLIEEMRREWIGDRDYLEVVGNEIYGEEGRYMVDNRQENKE